MYSETMKRNALQWQDQEITAEKRPTKFEENEEELRLHKRCKSSSSQTTNEWNLDSNEFAVPDYKNKPLNQPRPLGLRLKKNSSLLELIQKKLSGDNKKDVALPSENLQVKDKNDVKPRVGTSGPVDKLKASNFPALLLRIGQWEYVSKHEGDVVAKCYFAKHKLVWEVLDGGLKNKIEIQWADIVGLKANSPDKGPGTLTVVLGKQPLFFRETNPQPRRHTIWQSTSDFTNGEASTYKKHYLQCAQGVLNKHYEKLIQCDTRLNCLSQQSDSVLDLPLVVKASIKDPDVSGNNVSHQPEMSKGSSVSGITAMVSPSISQNSYLKTEELNDTLGLVHKDCLKDIHCISSAMPIPALEDYEYGESCCLQGPKTIKQLKTPKLQPAMSISALVNHIGHCISEKKPAEVLPFFENVSSRVNQTDKLENISNILLSDTHFTTASDEQALMSRVNSLCSLLQDSTPDPPKNHENGQLEGFDRNPTPENAMQRGWEDDIGDVYGYKQATGMSRKDSLNNLVHQLPRIASLPGFLFDLPEDDDIWLL